MKMTQLGLVSKLRQFGFLAKGVEQELQLSQHGAMLTQDIIPELLRAGRLYVAGCGPSTTAQAPATDMPTTGANWALYNGNGSATRKHLLPISVASIHDSGTAAIGGSLLGGVSGGAQAAALASDSGVTVVGCRDANQQSSNATLDGGVTLTSAAGWMALKGIEQGAAVNKGFAFVADNLFGKFAVPPGYCFGVTKYDAAAGTSPLYHVTILFAVLELDVD